VDGCRRHVGLGQKITEQAVGNLRSIDAVILLLGGGDRAQHKRVCDQQ
jgi:hypothetical protein